MSGIWAGVQELCTVECAAGIDGCGCGRTVLQFNALILKCDTPRDVETRSRRLLIALLSGLARRLRALGIALLQP